MFRSTFLPPRTICYITLYHAAAAAVSDDDDDDDDYILTNTCFSSLYDTATILGGSPWCHWLCFGPQPGMVPSY